MASTQDLWSNIPPELAGLFLGHLHAHVDRIRFAAVCPQWRTIARQVQLPPPLPLLALKVGGIFYNMPQGEPLHFARCKNGFTTACGKWLVYQRFHELLLADPFSTATITLPATWRVNLHGEDSSCNSEDSKVRHDSTYEDDGPEDGSASSMVCIPDKNGIGDSREDHDSADDGEDSKGSHDSADEGDYYYDGSVYTDYLELSMDIKSLKVIKLMECSPNVFAALFQGSLFSRIAVCRLGGSKWSVAWELSLGMITDMAFYQGKLYVVDCYEDLFALDISVNDKTGDPQVSRFRLVINFNRSDNELTLLRMLYLVESCGSLLLVRRRIFHEHVQGEGNIHTFAGQCEPDVLIFEADFGRSQWVKVTTLADDQALFLGRCSRAICMPQGDSPNNRVWFLDDYKDFYIWDENYNFSPGTSSVANPKPFSPLPMISWMGYQGNPGAAWLFPAN